MTSKSEADGRVGINLEPFRQCAVAEQHNLAVNLAGNTLERIQKARLLFPMIFYLTASKTFFSFTSTFSAILRSAGLAIICIATVGLMIESTILLPLS